MKQSIRASSTNDRADRREVVLEEAVRYAQMGLSIFPVKGKKPLVASVKSLRTRRIDPTDVGLRFTRSRDVTGVAIVLGSISQDLYVMDFDVPEAYLQWEMACPKLARSLPTALTSRGRHVYAQWPDVKTRKLPYGELLATGAYVLAPPSEHPDGGSYTWHIPLRPPVPIVSPAEAFFQCEIRAKKEGARSARPSSRLAGLIDNRFQSIGNPPEHQSTRALEHRSSRAPDAITDGSRSLRERDCVEQAIVATLPPGHGTRNRCIFEFARHLKALPAFAAVGSAEVRELRDLVKEWHRRALPKIRTKDFIETWGDFVHAWGSVKLAANVDVRAEALNRARSMPPPSWASDSDYPSKALLLATICRELQRQTGADPFYLSQRDAADLVGVDPTTANVWLKAFVADGGIAVVERGLPGGSKATRYRYIAGDLESGT